MDYVISPSIIEGLITIPPSKSDAQRAIIAAALAKGNSTISNYGTSDDVLHVIKVIESLGAQVVNVNDDVLEIIGSIERDQAVVNVGESGLAFRLLTPIVALSDSNITINGSGTLVRRSMRFFDEVLPQMNVSVSSNNGFLPITVQGPLKGGNYIVDGSLSSQYISGLLMALPLAKESTELIVQDLNSKPYVQMTLNTLSRFGIQIEHDHFKKYLIAGNQNYIPTTYSVEGDWSAASYWFVAAALGANISISGLSMSSLQADKKMLDALVCANCNLLFSAEGIRVNGEKRSSFEFDATHCPDLFPALVTLASFTEGKTIITGLSRLKNKESDRGKVLQSEFGKLGISIDLLDDEMHITGCYITESTIVNSNNDHRIAMCLAIAGLFTKKGITIQNAEAVSKSYPSFWTDLEHLIV